MPLTPTRERQSRHDLAERLDRTSMPHLLREFLAFTIKEAQSCVFAGSFFALLFLSTKFSIPGLARYDLILIGALLIQAALVAAGLESRDELKMIMAFHIIGFVLEFYKTQPAIGSWSYPEPGVTKIVTVPLYSGFMYSAIGSYMSQAWSRLDLRLVHYPKRWVTIALCVAIYVNFFTNAFLYDIRYWLIAAVIVTYARTRIYFTPLHQSFWMPAWLAFGLIAVFVWVAENISTFFGAWQYPDQALGWRIVDLSKLVSWSLLVILSFVLIAELKHLKAERAADISPEAG